jgi:hypothetical protein
MQDFIVSSVPGTLNEPEKKKKKNRGSHLWVL